MSADIEMTAQDDWSGQEVTNYVPTNVDLVTTVANYLANKVKAHDISFQTIKNPRTHFTASVAPQIGIDAYLFHLMIHIRTAPAIVVIMLIYIERLIEKLEKSYQKMMGTDAPFLMTSYNAHRILLTAFLLAHKYCEDWRYKNDIIAKIAGVPAKELKKLEYEFLKFVKFQLYVSEETFIIYHNAIVVYGRQLMTDAQKA